MGLDCVGRGRSRRPCVTSCDFMYIMLQRIVFLLKRGYALLVPIAELLFVGVIKISSSTVVRTGVFR